jgi:hypothetical protein
MSDLITIPVNKLPSWVKNAVINDDLSKGVAPSGYKVLHYKGKTWSYSSGGERTVLMHRNPDGSVSKNQAAQVIEVVVIKASEHISKVFYKNGYVEGSTEAPTCFSNNGTSPDTNAESPQATTCAACKNNQWGSRITESGSKGKACSDSRRLAVCTPDNPSEAILLRVPAASLKNLAQYGVALKGAGLSYQVVKTQISFDFNVAHPQLVFSAVDTIEEAAFNEVRTMSESEIVKAITSGSMAVSEGMSGERPAVDPAVASILANSKLAKAQQMVQEQEVSVAAAPKKVAKPKPALEAPVVVAAAPPTVIEPANDAGEDDDADVPDDLRDILNGSFDDAN